MPHVFRSLRLASAAVGAVLMCATAASAVSPSNSTLRVSHNEDGVIASSDGRISCGARCSASYARGALVTLTASAGREFEFEKWTGACVGKARHCTIALDRDAAVRAAFRRLPPPPPRPPATTTPPPTTTTPPPTTTAPRPPPPSPRWIGVTVSVSGQGFIAGEKIRCGGAVGTLLDCEGFFLWGEKIVLKAFPSRRGGFVRWGGFCRGEERSCTLRITSNKTVLAVFRR
jgi:hypothetical protein